MRDKLLMIFLAWPVSGICQEVATVPETLPELMEEMNETAARRAEEVRRSSVPLMSLRIMFEDEDVRRLARAAGRGDIDTIDQLVREGVDVNARGTRGATPLYWALRNKKGFRHLLELGADPNLVYDDEDRTSVMHATIEHRDPDFLRIALVHGGNPNLRARDTNETPLFDAVLPFGKDKLMILIEAGADIEARGHYGYTPLLAATNLDQFDIVFTLLEHGADYSVRSEYGRDLADLIALHRPLMNSDSEQWEWMLRVSSWLRDHGVDVPD